MAEKRLEKLKNDCIEVGATIGTIASLILWWNDIVTGLWNVLFCLFGITAVTAWLLYKGNLLEEQPKQNQQKKADKVK